MVIWLLGLLIEKHPAPPVSQEELCHFGKKYFSFSTKFEEWFFNFF